VPLASLHCLCGVSPQNADFGLNIFSLGNVGLGLETGKGAELFQSGQYNFVTSLYLQRGSHSLKFGVDYAAWPLLIRPPSMFKAQISSTLLLPKLAPLACCYRCAARATLLFNNIGPLFARHLARTSTTDANIWSSLGYRLVCALIVGRSQPACLYPDTISELSNSGACAAGSAPIQNNIR